MPSFYEEFGRRCTRRRHLLRLKQYEVAEAIGTQRSYVSALEHGRQQMMHLARVMALAKALQTSSDYLLQLTDEDPGVIPPTVCPAERPGLRSTTALLATLIPQGDDEYAS